MPRAIFSVGLALLGRAWQATRHLGQAFVTWFGRAWGATRHFGREFVAWLGRAWRSAFEEVGEHVKLAIIAALTAGLLGEAVGLPGVLVTVVAVVAWVIVLAGQVVWEGARHLIQPSHHRRWFATVDVLGEELIRFVLTSKIGWQVHPGMACDVLFPDGERDRASDDGRDTPYEFRPTFQWTFTASKEQAIHNEFPRVKHPIATGRYEYSWQELRANGKWHEIIRHHVDVKPEHLAGGWVTLPVRRRAESA
jgi:hypothetical protein